jgi:hypothetical protein
VKAFTAGFIFLCCFTAAISIVQAQAPYKRILDDPRAFNGPVGTVTDPSSLNSIPIGLFAPFNQDDPAALDLYRGVMLAIEQANATGGYQGVDFNLVQRWAGSPWAAGSKEVVRLVYEDRVWAVIAFRDGAGHIAQQIAAKAYVPVIAPLSSASSLTHTGVPWIFRLPPDDQIQARVLVQDGIVNMYRKFYKLLIIGNSQPTILHIQPGIMEWWNNGIIALHALVAKKKTAAKPAVPTVSAAGVYLPEGRHRQVAWGLPV